MLRPTKPNKPLCNFKRQEQEELALMAHTQLTMDEISNSDEYWIGDTGATTHITSIPEGIYNCARPDGTSKVVMGNGNKISKDKIGTLKGWIVDDNANSTTKIELGSVTVSSGAKFNLLSLTALMRLGWQLHGNKTSLILRKGNKQIKFQHQIQTENGLLFVLRIKRDIKEEDYNNSGGISI